MKLKYSVIGVMVLILTGTISGNDIKNALFQRLQDGSILQLSDEHVNTFDIIKVSSVSECAINCLSRECDSFTYKLSDHSCQNFHRCEDKIARVNSNDTDETSYITVERDGAVYVGVNGMIGEKARKPDDDNWIKMYSILAGSGVSVYNSYMGIGNRSTWSLHKECIQNCCSYFFRSPKIDVWESLPIDQVKLVIYKSGKPAVTMIFNGRKSTKANWFTYKRLLSSPWNDFKGLYVFSLGGSGRNRRVLIGKYSKTCHEESGWLAITEIFKWCPWEKGDSYPNILFSKQTNATVWAKERGVGDSMAIFIKLI